MTKKGILTVISGFSGAGKGTIVHELVDRYGYAVSISATTRDPRAGEQDGVHYFFKTKEELKCYYQAADLFVFPTREDIWGLVVNEAMANGLPVITTDKCVAGLELIRDGENGYIVPVENVDILAGKITVLLQNDSLRKIMAQKSLEYIKRYTIENMAVAHLKIIRSEDQSL